MDGAVCGVGLTGFVDDLANRCVASSPAGLLDEVAVARDILAEDLAEAGVALNSSKEMIVVEGPGVYNVRAMQRALASTGKVVHAARYLGCQIAMGGSMQQEVEMRIRSVKCNFSMLRWFWHRKGLSWRVVRLTYLCLCHGAAVAGWNAFVVSHSAAKQIDVVIVGQLRSLMKGKAHWINEDSLVVAI